MVSLEKHKQTKNNTTQNLLRHRTRTHRWRWLVGAKWWLLHLAGHFLSWSPLPTTPYCLILHLILHVRILPILKAYIILPLLMIWVCNPCTKKHQKVKLETLKAQGRKQTISELGSQSESKLIKWEGKKGIPGRDNSTCKGRQTWEDAKCCSLLSWHLWNLP